MEGTLCGSEPSLNLIETLCWDGSRYKRLDLHLARLMRSAARLGWQCDVIRVRHTLEGAVSTAPARVRLTLDSGGDLVVQAVPLPAPAANWRVMLSPVSLQADDPWLTIKTTRRTLYDRTRAELPPDVDEAIFLNSCDEVCEGTITNLFYDLGGGLCTPPASCGLLPGVLRAELLASNQCREAVLMADDLPRAKLWVGNSVRGLIAADLTGPAGL
ncbi:aminotransferase class IV family protein [Falsirhodobacter sp. alg1]|uniref:aminotransferase class IV family protein n=1 Tax=Falsirhodobacter sp. alg1 TaxID=1472418 RepID=UPI001EDC7259|nr:aminotransferase class IV family protein [Falsirhodobacter sp. alg1]